MSFEARSALADYRPCVTHRTRSLDMWIELDEKELLRLPQAGGLVVHCQAGCLWVTRYGDRRDHVLERGGVLQLPDASDVVVQALAAARFSVRVAPGEAGGFLPLGESVVVV
jgi:hypothetical protein